MDTEEPQIVDQPEDGEKELVPPPEMAPPRTMDNPQESTPKKRMVSPRSSRTIKSNKPDLKIYIGGGEETDDEEETRFYQSATMAEHSNFIDTTIDTLIAENVEKPYEIRFTDISVDTWDLMMKFLDPVESRDMSAKDVLVVGEYYDRYDFPLGRKLCDKVLQEYFLSESNNEEEMDVEMLVDAVALAFKAHLDMSYEIGNKFVKEKLMSYKDKMFNKDLMSVPESETELGTPTGKSRRSFGVRRSG